MIQSTLDSKVVNSTFISGEHLGHLPMVVTELAIPVHDREPFALQEAVEGIRESWYAVDW